MHHTLTLIWTLKKSSFCSYVLTLAKTAAVKSFAWFLSLSPLPTAASIHESPTRKRGARNLDQPGACAFRIPLAENSLWASWSLLQICSFNLFTHYIFIRKIHERSELNFVDGIQTFWYFYLLCDYSILWRGNFSCLELKKEECSKSVDMWKQFSPSLRDIYSSVEFPFGEIRLAVLE